MHVRRRDTIQAGGRQQTTESQQTMTLTRAASGWVIREIAMRRRLFRVLSVTANRR